MNKFKQRNLYIIWDIVAALLSWILFFGFRKHEEGYILADIFKEMARDTNFWSGLAFYPLFWFVLHHISGSYRNVLKKARLDEVKRTFISCALGCLFLFFAIILDDIVSRYTIYYLYLFVLFGSYFPFLILFRLILTERLHHRIQERKLGFKTLLIGNGPLAKQIYKEIQDNRFRNGIQFSGYIAISEDNSPFDGLACVGELINLGELVQKEKIEEVIIALETDQKNILTRILGELYVNKISIKITPNFEDYLTGAIRNRSILDSPLIEMSFDTMSYLGKSIKRLFDICFCGFALFILSPFLAYVALRVRKSSKGPVFYQQERIGLHGKPFFILKFRSMYLDAEKGFPILSSDNDPRITPWGRFMRKYRIDELPQFFNVLKGEMSVIGPRPERAFFISKICEKAPHYRLLLNARPGVSSWGEVKYGYAENVDQMIERMKYDLLYLENRSLLIDFKIFLHTIVIVFAGRGK